MLKLIRGDIMTIPERIKALREERTNYNQTEFGKLMNLSQLQISRLETGRTHLKEEEIILYCNFFNVSADYILGLPDLPYPKR